MLSKFQPLPHSRLNISSPCYRHEFQSYYCCTQGLQAEHLHQKLMKSCFLGTRLSFIVMSLASLPHTVSLINLQHPKRWLNTFLNLHSWSEHRERNSYLGQSLLVSEFSQFNEIRSFYLILDYSSLMLSCCCCSVGT